MLTPRGSSPRLDYASAPDDTSSPPLDALRRSLSRNLTTRHATTSGAGTPPRRNGDITVGTATSPFHPVPSQAWIRNASKLLADGKLSKRGAKRATTYSAGQG
ncbi:MAG: hypothetical protein WKG00_04620 [Polyangiaceae bacterium]